MVTYMGEYEYPSEALMSLFAAAGVVVLASTVEPFGLVPFEALAAGTPSILTDKGGYDRPGSPPYFQRVNPYSVTDIGAALRIAMEAPRNREACREQVEDLTWAAVAQTLIGIYEDLLSKKNESR